jgi:hypothetical protein
MRLVQVCRHDAAAVEVKTAHQSARRVFLGPAAICHTPMSDLLMQAHL